MRVEVVYALPGSADRVTLELPDGASAADAVASSGVLQRHPEIAAAKLQLGIFGRVVELDYLLNDGDRVEIYRGLRADPKHSRRDRAGRQARRRS